MTERITGDWLDTPATARVMAALDAARPGATRFVGGCVRNALLGRPVDDIDLATQLHPDQTLQALKVAGLRAIPTGIDHGTITAVADGQAFEITSLRKDVETDGRRAVVAFTEDWQDDAQRRDFRLNAIYADRDGQLFTPIEGSLEDARTGRIVFIGEAEARIREDYLRILRFFRFNAWYGQAVDPVGLRACQQAAGRLNVHVAAERRWVELTKLLSAPDPAPILSTLDQAGFVEILFGPGARNRLGALMDLEQAAGLMPDPVRRLMALLPQTPAAVAWVRQAYKPSNAVVDRLQARLQVDMTQASGWTGADWRAALYTHAPQAVTDASLGLALQQADAGVLIRALAAAGGWTRPKLPVSGGDLLDRGLSGPVLGETLRMLEQHWIESDFTLSRQALLERLDA